MVNEINRYAEKVLNETLIRRRSCYNDWKPTVDGVVFRLNV